MPWMCKATEHGDRPQMLVKWLGRAIGFFVGSWFSPTVTLWFLVLKPYFDSQKAFSGLMPCLHECQRLMQFLQHHPDQTLLQLVPSLTLVLAIGCLYMALVSWAGERLMLWAMQWRLDRSIG